MSGTAHKRGLLLKSEWAYNGKNVFGQEIYEHLEKGWINLYNPNTNEFTED